MVTAETIFEIATRQGIQTTLFEIEEELGTFDRGQMLEQYKARISTLIWNGQNPINNVPADEVKQSEKLPENAMGYWVFIDGEARLLQLTSPFAGEYAMLDLPTVENTAQRHVDHIAEVGVGQEILRIIIIRLRERADTRLQAIEDGLLALMLQGGAN